MTGFTLDSLAETVAARAASTADKSYTRSLLDGGMRRVAQKFGEEAVELAIAAAAGDAHEVKCEAADVLYHLLVLLRGAGVALSEVMGELDRRSGVSGHDEKASRAAPGNQDSP